MAQTISSLPPHKARTLYNHTVPHTLKKTEKTNRKYFPFNCPRESVAELGAAFPSSYSALEAGLECGRSNYRDTASPATAHGNMLFYLHPDFERVCVAEVYLSQISLSGRGCSFDLRILGVGEIPVQHSRSEPPGYPTPTIMDEPVAEKHTGKQLEPEEEVPTFFPPCTTVCGSRHPQLGNKRWTCLPSTHTFRLLFWLSSLPRSLLLFFET